MAFANGIVHTLMNGIIVEILEQICLCFRRVKFIKILNDSENNVKLDVNGLVLH